MKAFLTARAPITAAEMRHVNAAVADLHNVPRHEASDDGGSVTESAIPYDRPTSEFFTAATALWLNGSWHSENIAGWRRQARNALRWPGSVNGVGGVMVAEAAHQPRTSHWLYRGVGSWHDHGYCDLSSWSASASAALLFAGASGRSNEDPPTVLRLAPGALGADLDKAHDLSTRAKILVQLTAEVVSIGDVELISDKVFESGVRIVDLAPHPPGQ